MKVYFVASIKGRKKFRENYEEIVNVLKDLGHQAIENILEPTDQYVYGLSDSEKVNFYKKVLKWINSSDVVVAEASYPSINVGHEISLAMEKGKPVVVLSTEEDVPHFIQGIDSEKLFVIKYNLGNLKTTLKEVLEDAKEQMDVRFNFFISPKIGVYLDWISKNKKIPRAVYLRKLIEEDMKKNKEFKGK